MTTPSDEDGRQIVSRIRKLILAIALTPIGTIILWNGHTWLWNGWQWILIG